MASPMRLNSDLIEAAKMEGMVQKRSIPMQIEYWAELGRAVEGIIDLKDVFAVMQGVKTVRLESAFPGCLTGSMSKQGNVGQGTLKMASS